MQSNFRQTFIKIGTFILFGLLIASFALWGIGDIFRGGGRGDVVIQVGDQEIGRQEFARTFQRQFNRVRQAVGGDLDMERARQMGIVDQIVRQTVTRALFDQQAKDMGLAVGDEQVVSQIRQQSNFQNSLGEFDRQLFEQTLRRSGLSEADYVELLRSDINRQHLANAATGGLAVPQPLVDAIYSYRNEARVAAYIELPHADFEVAEPEQSALRSYYEDNGGDYMAPEYRKLTLIHITADDLMQEVGVSEDELRQAYEARKSEFGEPERRTAEQIVFDSKEQAESARDLLMQGRTFDAVAEQVTGKAPIDLGTNTREDMLDALAEPTFELGEGEVSAPIESPLGWHLVKVTGIQEGKEPSFEAARPQLREELAKDKAVDSLVSLANKLDDELASGASLEEAANNLDLPIRTIDAISREGNAPDGDAVKDLPQQSEFLPVAFQTQQGQQSLLKETPQGDYFVLRVDSVTPSQRRPFEEVQDQVRADWTTAQRRQKADAAAEEIEQAVAGGKALADVAAERGREVRQTQPLTRSGNQQASAAGRALAGPLFDVAQGEPVTASVSDAAVVGVLTEVQAAQPDANGDAVSQLRQQLAEGLRSDVLAQFAGALRSRYEVRVNQTALDQILGRFQ